MLDSEDVKNALIFCNRKRDIGVLQRSLVRHGYNAVSLHGDMSQPARLETLEKFKNDEADLMVASDVAARGLDIKGLSHVFNFDVPSNPEDYVHRIGRTGRAGSEGRAFTLATPEDARYLANIVKLIGGEIPPFQVAGVDNAADPARRRRHAAAGPSRRVRNRRKNRWKPSRKVAKSAANAAAEANASAAPSVAAMVSARPPRCRTTAGR